MVALSPITNHSLDLDACSLTTACESIGHTLKKRNGLGCRCKRQTRKMHLYILAQSRYSKRSVLDQIDYHQNTPYKTMLKMKTRKVFIKEVGWWVKNRSGKAGSSSFSTRSYTNAKHSTRKKKSDPIGLKSFSWRFQK